LTSIDSLERLLSAVAGVAMTACLLHSSPLTTLYGVWTSSWPRPVTNGVTVFGRLGGATAGDPLPPPVKSHW